MPTIKREGTKVTVTGGERSSVSVYASENRAKDAANRMRKAVQALKDAGAMPVQLELPLPKPPSKP